jgi:rfaE bifunctional protein kinase chain/domain
MRSYDFDTLFENFRSIKVLVVGDVMLDAYLWGRVDRISPEAPVPVVQLTRKDYRIGGAGNVALNLASLGATASMLSVTGDDDEGKILRAMLQEGGIGVDGIQTVQGRVTTTKTRVISRNQQMMRIDSEVTDPLDSSTSNELTKAIIRQIDTVRPQVLIFEDYDKGVLSATLIASVVAHCRQLGVITAVDPKRRNFFCYDSVDIFKPNLQEIRDALGPGFEIIDLSSLTAADRMLRERLGHQYSFITLSDRGVFHSDGENARIVPSHRRNISDVSGAGDTVIAVATLVFAATGDMGLAAELANIAGGLVCEQVGTVAVDRSRLLEECHRILGS